MKQIVLDTETTGLSVKDGHRIVEIACLELDNFLINKKIFHYYLNPERRVSAKALEVHGHTDEFLSSKKKFKDIADDFLDFIEGKEIIIHNADFDIAHINNELSMIGKPKIEKKYVIDTLELARNKFPGSAISLDALCKRFRIDNSRRVKHTAIIDCELLSKVYINLIDQKEPTLDFKTSATEITNLENKFNEDYCKRIILATAEELKQHKQFLEKSVKKNYF